MTGCKSIIVQMDESFKREVRTGDDKRLDVHGIGDIAVETKIGKKKNTKCIFRSRLEA